MPKRDHFLENDTRISDGFQLVHHRCNSAYCPTCGRHKAIRLQGVIEGALIQWKQPKMITLTINRENFATPQEAYEYVMNNKLVSRLIRDLDRTHELLNRRDYVWTMEFHKVDADGLIWPHWHILVDADYIPMPLLHQIWQRFAPPEPEGGRCQTHDFYLGKTWVSGPPKFHQNKAKLSKADQIRFAARYLTAYLKWFPDEDKGECFPDWILNSRNIPRSHTSQGFLKNHGLDKYGEDTSMQAVGMSPESESVDFHNGNFFQTEINGVVETFLVDPESGAWTNVAAPDLLKGQGTEKEKAERKTIVERVESCKTKTVILKTEVWQTPQGQIMTQYFYVDTLDEPFYLFSELSDTELTHEQIDKLIYESRMRTATAKKKLEYEERKSEETKVVVTERRWWD